MNIHFFDYKLVENFDRQAVKMGLSGAARDVLSRLNVMVDYSHCQIPETGPVLLISNHPGGLDSYCVMSTTSRKDFHFVAIANYQVFGPTLGSHLLPIYRPLHLNNIIFEYPRDLVNHVWEKRMSAVDIKTKNKATLAQAAKHLNQGHLVAIFPMGKTGRKQEGSKWKIGVGLMVDQVTNPETRVIFLQIKGPSRHDYLRFVRPFWRRFLFKNKPYQLITSKPQKLFHLIGKNDDALEIMHKLEVAYNRSFDS